MSMTTCERCCEYIDSDVENIRSRLRKNLFDQMDRDEQVQA